MFYYMQAFKEYYHFEVDSALFHKWMVGRIKYYESSNVVKRSIFDNKNDLRKRATTTESWEQLMKELDENEEKLQNIDRDLYIKELNMFNDNTKGISPSYFPYHKTTNKSWEQLMDELEVVENESTKQLQNIQRDIEKRIISEKDENVKELNDIMRDTNESMTEFENLEPLNLEPLTWKPLNFDFDQHEHYHPSDYSEAKGWRMIQLAFSCCGVDSYEDWKAKLNPNVPDSCCVSVYQGCGSDVFGNLSNLDNIHQRGCFPFLKNHFNEYILLETFDFQLCCLCSFIGLIFISICLFLCARSRRSLHIVQKDLNNTDVQADKGHAEDEGDSDEYDNEEDQEDEDDVELLQVGRNESDNESDSDLNWMENNDDDGPNIDVQNSEQGSNDFIININDPGSVITPLQHETSHNLITF